MRHTPALVVGEHRCPRAHSHTMNPEHRRGRRATRVRYDTALHSSSPSRCPEEHGGNGAFPRRCVRTQEKTRLSQQRNFFLFLSCQSPPPRNRDWPADCTVFTFFALPGGPKSLRAARDGTHKHVLALEDHAVHSSVSP